MNEETKALGEVHRLYQEYYNRTDHFGFNPYLKIYSDGSGGLHYIRDDYKSSEGIIVFWNDLGHAVRVLKALLDQLSR